jgi:IS30 family transposase
MQKTVAVNERGLRIGEDHPRAELTDAEVERIRELHEEGMSYRQLAEKFEQSKGAIAKICRYERRGQFVASFKAVPVLDCE